MAWCAALVLAWTLVGCNKKSDEAAPTASTKELNLFAWSEYVPQKVIDGFTAETGIKVNYETYASNEEMLSKLIAGASHYDLIQPSEYMVEALAKAGKLKPLNKEKLTNLGNIGKEYLNLGHDPEQKYSVPWMVGTVGIVVNTEKVKEPILSYKDFFQSKYKGRIVVLNDSREIVSWGLSTLGKDPNDVSDENLAAVKPVISKWFPLIKIFDSDSPKTAMLNGDVDLGIVWNGEGAKLYQENKKFQYILPKEGTHLFIDSLCIPTGSENSDAAELFINYILRPEVSKLISDEFPYTNPNLEARKLLSPEQLENPASYPKGNPKLGIFLDIGKKLEAIDQMVTDLKSSQ
jgi:spermidine/putrescine transport system substrate-binding protein